MFPRHNVALALAGGLGMWLGFPNEFTHIPLCVLIYPAALCLLGFHARSAGEALRFGWITGLVGASLALRWLSVPVQEVGGLPLWLATPCAVAIGAYVGLYGGLFAAGAWLARGAPCWALALGLGALWYLLELARGVLFTGFPWLALAAAFAPWPFMTQGAHLVGAYALGGALASAACLVALGTRVRYASHVAALLLAIIAGYGVLRLQDAPPLVPQSGAAMPAPHGALACVLVEGNIDQNQKWDKALQTFTLETYADLTRRALAEAAAQAPAQGTARPLVIWPETAMPFYLTHPAMGPALRQFVTETGTSLLVGAPGVERPTPGSFNIFNRAYLLAPSGETVGWYDKMHLVPFGEYVPPFLGFDFLQRLLQGVGDFTPGKASAPLPLPHRADARLGVLLCYEAIFPELALQRVQDGATVLVNISNDGWFGTSAAPAQHLQLAALRAVEQERWLVRGTNTGISAIIDPYGRVALRGGQFRRDALHGHCWTKNSKSVYFSLHGILPWLALGLLAVAGAAAPGLRGRLPTQQKPRQGHVATF